MLEEGDNAPEVSLKNQRGDEVVLSYSEPTVVYFYPGDGTPGCTTEADQFNEEIEVYEEAGVKVYGISNDTVESHREFADERGLEFDILADSENRAIEDFGVETQSDGSAERTTFVIVDGKLERVYKKVDPDGHAREVLRDLLEEGVVELDWY